MKQQFSTHWVSSTQPRKQRKYRYNAPLHLRAHFMHAHLSKELRAKHGSRAIQVRAGDEVKIMRGQFAGKIGKIERIDLFYTRVFISGIESVKRDGTKKPYPLTPNKLLITKLADDKRRFPVEQKTRKPQAPNVPKARPKAEKAKAKITDTKTKAKPAKK